MCQRKPVPGYESLLEVCLCGRVYRKAMTVRSPQSGGSRTLPEIECKVRDVKGYWSANVSIRGKRLTLYVHRLIAKAFLPNPESKPCINHKNGNKKDNRLENLEWCTHAENMSHAFSSGLTPYPKTGPGEKSPSAKLNNEKVAEIKSLIRNGATNKEISATYGVSPGTIGFIRSGDTWVGVGDG